MLQCVHFSAGAFFGEKYVEIFCRVCIFPQGPFFIEKKRFSVKLVLIWCLLVLIGAYWCLLVLIGAYWCLLVLIVAYCCLLLVLIGAYWCLLLLIVGAYWCLFAAYWCLLVPSKDENRPP